MEPHGLREATQRGCGDGLWFLKQTNEWSWKWAVPMVVSPRLRVCAKGFGGHVAVMWAMGDECLQASPDPQLGFPE